MPCKPLNENTHALASQGGKQANLAMSNMDLDDITMMIVFGKALLEYSGADGLT